MEEEERWHLGTALAIVQRGADSVRVRLQGVVTAMVYEALHLRLAREKARRRELVLDHDALLVMTCRSAVEAALRGTPIADRQRCASVAVPLTRLAWALEHCMLMTRCGLCRVAAVLERAA